MSRAELIEIAERCANINKDCNCESCKFSDSLYCKEKIISSLIDEIKNAEKYKWHDLRNNPDDLPKKQGEYDIVYKFRDRTGRTYESYNAADGFCTPEEYPCIAWREVEPFEELKETL